MGLFYLDETVNLQTAKRAGISIPKAMRYNRMRYRKELEYYKQNPKPGKSPTDQYVDSIDHKFRHSY